MAQGGLRVVSWLVGKRNPDAVSFDTPAATIGIRGTNFGALFYQNDCGSVPTPNGKTPVVIPPTQGVPVTMPLSISKNAPSMGPSSNAQSTACIVQ